ncbi:N-acetylmuramoyl-L-alanine amidase [Streptosporangium roseum]|uniref:peptidoglycan recognition protein family protein n=1 Tax=Streptosporangium roseum TaxID=2001 RepID=UPI00068970A5|nr:N-acetylmuramoyl-L-alanine amidase [Streptosporangium roseum]
MKLVTRAQWGARPAKRGLTPLPSARGVKIHYVGSRVNPSPTKSCGAHCRDMVRGIQSHHMDGNGWSTIAYNLLVCEHGTVFEGRGKGIMSAANGPGFNQGHYAVCALIGDKGLVEPTDELLNGLVDAIGYLRNHGAGREVKGHRDGYSTTCPGDRLYRWVRAGAHRPDASEEKPIEIVVRDGVALWPGRTLELVEPMMHGEDVKAWQARLAKRGWQIGVDGWYGSQSRSVCRSWQRAVGLPITGKVDEATWESTWSWRPPTPDPADETN